MASITIRNLEDELKSKLRMRAARNGRSMEEEVRVILREALARPSAPEKNLAELIRERFAEVGGMDLDLPPRDMGREPPDFSGRENGFHEDETPYEDEDKK